MKRKYQVRVNHSLGFYSFYEVEASDWMDAEKEAKRIFTEEFCSPTLETEFRGVTTKHYLKAYTFNHDIQRR